MSLRSWTMWAGMTGIAGMTGAGWLWAQASKPAAPPLAFEVASIRAAALPTPESFRNTQFRAGSSINGTRLDFEFVSMADLLPYVYGVKNFQVSGPASLRESRWNIVAKLPDGATAAQVPDMMRDLLVDRFKLAIHHEKREQPVYELVVSKEGAKIEADPLDPKDAAAEANAPALPGLFRGPFGGPPDGGRGLQDGRGGDGRGTDGRNNAQQDGRGGNNGPGGGGRGFPAGGIVNGNTRIAPNANNCGIHLELSKQTMQALADTLTPFLDRPVVDETGLKGTYKVALDLPMEAMFSMMQSQMQGAGLPFGGRGDGGRGGDGGGRGGDGGGRGGPFGGCADPGAQAAGDNSNAALFQAVQKLGLKLQTRKAPFDTIVVDHLDKMPTEN